jgi:glycogen(starch) synthase
MRVLMTADAVGGVWSYALTLAESLRSDDVEVTLATLGPRPDRTQRMAADRLGNVRLFESSYRLEWMPEGWKDVDAAGQWLMQLADDEAIDIVHLNGYALASLPWQQPTICVAHSCVSSWWRAVHGVSPPAEWSAYCRGVAQGLRSADHVVAPSHAFLSELRSCYDEIEHAQVIHNGITRRGADAESKQRLPIVFACGRPWDAAKNMAVLDAAADQVTWRVYLAGNAAGPDGAYFRGSALHLLGSLSNEDVALWLSRASIFVHPALYEPFGLAVLEAASFGCALVLADIPTLRELWEGAAEFFDPRDARALLATLDSLIADPDRRRRLGAAARDRADCYSARAMASAYRDLYEASLYGAPITRIEPVRLDLQPCGIQA